MIDQLIFLTNVVSTLMMTGIMWFVHLIHYPILSYVNQADLAEYESQHVKHTMKWALLILIVELVSAALLIWFRPEDIGMLQVIVGLSLLVPIWIVTWAGCVPGHCKLETGYNDVALRKLLKNNFIRTLCWTARTVVIIWMLVSVLV